MAANDFWSRKKAELQEEGKLTKGPAITGIPYGVSTQATRVYQGQAWWQEQESAPEKEHDFSKAEHLKHQSNCPNCNSGNYMRATASTARRCTECGYVEGRQVTEPSLPIAINVPAKTLSVKQADTSRSQGHFGRSAAEIAQNNAALEQSAQGKMRLNA